MHQLVNGPLNKSLHTEMYELFIKCNLHAKQQVNYFLEDNGSGKENLFASIGSSIKLNISELSQKVNFNHLSLDSNDSAKFASTFNSSNYYDGYYNYLYFNKADKYADITPGEKQAIQNYTGSEYYSINSFLYGKTGSIYNYYDNGINDSAQRLVLNTAFLSSGLNKIMPELNYHGETYRGEHAASFEEIQSRIELIDSDFPVSQSPAFISTSSDSWVGDGFSSGSFITFTGAFGKDVSGLSYFESESEYLVLPSQILWENYEYSNGTYYFKASVVAPLVEGKDVASQEEINQFQALQAFAEDNNIDTDFISKFNRAMFLGSEDKIEINDVLSGFKNTDVLFEHSESLGDSQINSHANNTAVSHMILAAAPETPLSNDLIETDAML